MNSSATPDTLFQAGSFLDPVAAAIVLGGTVAVVLLRSPFTDLIAAMRALIVVGRRKFSADALLAQIEALSRIAKNHGVMTLDRSVIRDGDAAAAIAAIVDRAPPDRVRALLDQRRQASDERHLGAIAVWTAIAETAPALGMIGTLIGLVRMFTTIDDPKAIGGAMAIALLTTLYGAVIASVIALPVASRLRALARAESIERTRLVAPLVALAARELPRSASQDMAA